MNDTDTLNAQDVLGVVQSRVFSILCAELQLASVGYFLDQSAERFPIPLFQTFQPRGAKKRGWKSPCNLLTTSGNSSGNGNLAPFKLS
jgi:hypothetical protein